MNEMSRQEIIEDAIYYKAMNNGDVGFFIAFALLQCSAALGEIAAQIELLPMSISDLEDNK